MGSFRIFYQLSKSPRFVVAVGMSLTPGCMTQPGGRVQDPITPTEIVSADGGKSVKTWIEEVDANIGHDESADEGSAIEVEPSPAPSASVNHEITLEVNDKVQEWIDYFTGSGRERMQRYITRGEKFRPLIERALAERQVPAKLYYLAMIESGFAVHARSRASAVGIWQFISGTGRRYGLTVSPYLDERRDPEKATYAAINYLQDLHRVFGDWYLAMAAYNAGEMRILRAIMNSQSRDFWTLAKDRRLPKETMNYIPKFLAAAIIGDRPERFGFVRQARTDEVQLAKIAVPAPLSLKSVATTAGINYHELANHNPALLRGVVPATSTGSYEIWIPAEAADRVEERRAQLAGLRLKNTPKAYLANATVTKAAAAAEIHIVRKGENLAMIARRYGTTPSKLMRDNRLRSARIYPKMRLRLYTVTATRQPTSTASALHHQVKRGENLSTIARRYGTSVSALKRWNSLRRNVVFVGQRLTIKQSI